MMKQKLILKVLIVGLVISLSVTFIPIVVAQVYSSGCHPDFRNRISATTSEIDFDAMCDVYVQCLSTNSLDCILPAFEVVFLRCDGVDACENEAILYSATIDLLNHPNLTYGLSFETLPIDDVVGALNFIQTEDYELALDSYNGITTRLWTPYDSVEYRVCLQPAG